MDKRKILADILSGKVPLSSAPRTGLLQIGATDTEGIVSVNGVAMNVADAKKRIRTAAMVLFWHKDDKPKIPAELISPRAHKISFRKPRGIVKNNE